MPTDPSLISGFQSTYLFDADTIAGADNSVITSYGPYAVPGAYAGPNLKLSAINSQKSLVFAPGKALSVDVPPVTPINSSGGAYPVGLTVMAVVKATSLTNLSVPPFTGTRRTILGLRGGWNSQDVPGGLEVYSNNKLLASMISSTTTGYWGWNGPNGVGTVGLDQWYVLGLTSDGQYLKTYKGLALDRTAVNDGHPTYSQFVGGFTLGADAAFPGLQDWTGEIAYVAMFDRELSLSEYREGASWLLNRYGLPLREIAVEADTGTSGTFVFFSLKSSSTGEKVWIPASTTITSGSVTYKIDGGSAITPAQLLYQPVVDAVPSCALLGFRTDSPITAGQTVTLSIAANSVLTNEGYVDELVDGPVTNNVGASAILPQTIPTPNTMKVGYNISGPGQYWTPESSIKNVLKSSGDNYGTLAVDSLGYRTSPSINLRYLIRSGSNDATDGSRVVVSDFLGAEFGRYVVTWEGDDGTDLALEVSASDAGQTVVTPELVNDVMTGPTKKRYFDVAKAGGSIRERPCFDLVYKAGVYVTNVEAKLARYEGTSGIFADQVINRAVNCEGWRFMDFIPTNFSNIGHAEEFAVNNSLGYGSTLRRTVPITRIESYEGPHYAPDTNSTHYLITTSVPHGLADGQAILIERTDSNPINVTHVTRGVVDMTYKGWSGHALSPTTFYFHDYTPETPHEATTVPFTGSNAILSVSINQGAPIEVAAALVNETDANRMNFCVPHACTDAAIQHIATRLAASLDAGRKVDLELSNEVWNFAFSQYTYFRAEGIRRGLQAQDSGQPNYGYAARSAEMWDVFKAKWLELGRSASDLRLVFNFQQGNSEAAGIVAEWLETNRPDITSVVVAVAPYHYWNGLYNVSGFDYSTLTVEECLDFQECWAKAEMPLFYDAQVAEFTSRGISADLIAYEYQWAYMGLGPEGAGSTRDEKWDLHNRISLACRAHPRSRAIKWVHMKKLQDRGLALAYEYGYTAGPVYEHGVVGQGTYGVYPSGLLQDPGLGDGTDGKPDNRPLLVDGTGKPKWPPHLPKVSTQGRAVLDWMAASAGVTPLTAAWASVTTPRTTPVDSIGLTFSESVTGVGIESVSLTRDGSSVSLSGASLTGSGVSYTLSGLTSATTTPGVYVLRLTASGSGISTPSLVELSADAVRVWTTEAEPPAPTSGLEPQLRRLNYLLRI